MVQVIESRSLVSSLKRIVRKNIKHEDKVPLLLSLQNNRTPNEQYLVRFFIDAENLLAKKKGLEAAERLDHVHAFIPGQVWLYEHQAYLFSRYAYHNISSGAINRAFDIYTKVLGWRPDDAWLRLAVVLKKHKGFGFAAQCYTNAGKPEFAARMLKSNRSFQQAGWYFEQAGIWKDAALCYRKDKIFDKAGECFERSGDRKSAFLCYKKAGTLEKHGMADKNKKENKKIG